MRDENDCIHSMLTEPLQNLDIAVIRSFVNDAMGIAELRMIALKGPSCKSNEEFQPLYGGVASCFVRLLKIAVDNWNSCLPSKQSSHWTTEEKKEEDANIPLITDSHSTKKLQDVLSLILHISKTDITLAEEMAKGCGSHKHLSQLIMLDVYDELSHYESCGMDKEVYEAQEDVLVEIQDIASEIAYCCDPSIIPYPCKVSPYTFDELLSRLPLTFHVTSPRGIEERLMIHQVTAQQSCQDDVGFVMWPSAVVLSSWLLDNYDAIMEETVSRTGSGKRRKILEIGAGCGLSGLVAATIAKKKDNGTKVIISDFNHKVLENVDRNISLNALCDVSNSMKLDFYLQKGENDNGGWIGSDNNDVVDFQEPVDLILAADTICKPSDSIAVSKTIYDGLKPGGIAIVVSADAKHRFGVDIFEKECLARGLSITTTDIADLSEGKLLPKDKDAEDPCSIRQTSGFVEGMTLTMFCVRKP